MTRDVREVVREGPLVKDRLLALLADEAMTVPDLAAASGLPAEEVMAWVMGLRRYGHVSVETGPNEDGYYHYRATGQR